MTLKKKTVQYSIASIFIIFLVVFLYKIYLNSQISKEIPDISISKSLSEEVTRQIKNAVKKTKRNPSSENLGLLGMVYHSSANYSEAAKCYNLANGKNKAIWIWNYYNGYLNMEMGNSEKAIENFTAVVELNPANELAWFYIGSNYKNLKNYELAEKYLSRIAVSNVRNNNENPLNRADHFQLSTYAKFELSRIYFETQRIELAEKTLTEIIQNDNLFGPSFKLLGNIYNLRGNPTLGKKFNIRANDLVDYSPPVDTIIDRLSLMSMSEMYLLKKIDEAEKSIHSDWALRLVNHGLNVMPENKYLISKAIKIFLWKKLNENAKELIDKHIGYFKDDFNELNNTGMLFYQKEMYPETIKFLIKASEMKPNEFIVQKFLSKSLWNTGQKEKSLEIVNNFTENNKNNPDVLAECTELFFQFGLIDKTNEYLKRLFQISPSNSLGLRISGEIAEVNGEKKKAISLYELSFKGNPEDLKTIINLGNLYQNQNMWKNYIQHCRNALEFHPNNPEILARLGESLISSPDSLLRNLYEGKDYLERAFTFYNCPPDILIASGSNLAYAYTLIGEKQKALTTISQTINIGRHLNIPASKQTKLENFYKMLKNMSN